MADDPSRRRDFLKLCGGAAALVAGSPELLATPRALTEYDRARLIDDTRQPLRLSNLRVGETYVFHYPYIATPCFLMDLGHPAPGGIELRTEKGDTYVWSGGVGPRRSVVAFSAICAHQMSHPARSVSFISYRHETTRYVDLDKQRRERPEIIYCCSEKSVYDVGRGAAVLGGPAPQPLAAVELDYDDAEDALFAVGVRGGEMFDKFFAEFEFRLILDYSTENITRPVRHTSVVQTLREFSQNYRLC